MSTEDVRWNFEKVPLPHSINGFRVTPPPQILFDRDGQPYRRYASSVEPLEIEEDIATLLAR